MPVARFIDAPAAASEAPAATPAELSPLSPWPSTAPEEAAAIVRLKAAIGDDLEDARVQALGTTAAARVEKEAPGAPQPVRDEAVIRFAGYLADGAFGAVQSESSGPFSTTLAPNHAGAFRLCGAYGLLAPWKVRRAGAIG